MLAVLHVASGKVLAAKKHASGVPELLAKAKIKELVKAKVAVLDGNALAPSQPREHGKVKTYTLWGELAWQLGGDAGYALVAASDADGTSPGKDVLAELFEAARAPRSCSWTRRSPTYGSSRTARATRGAPTARTYRSSRP